MHYHGTTCTVSFTASRCSRECAGTQHQREFSCLSFLTMTAPDPRASLDFDIATTIPQHLEIVREILDGLTVGQENQAIILFLQSGR
jgi:hypothetical protein